ncbi:hypothetical protein A3Q56_04144 [Intoshia linei]|uniref:Uncharacterized protein n=1 Tax=Intoshia linei TaxID=1819745 RepID=A0A177B1I8_9BILA|nr:hypothetical protein A3Q56_04144 [Intoshia linei]
MKNEKYTGMSDSKLRAIELLKKGELKLENNTNNRWKSKNTKTFLKPIRSNKKSNLNIKLKLKRPELENVLENLKSVDIDKSIDKKNINQPKLLLVKPKKCKKQSEQYEDGKISDVDNLTEKEKLTDIFEISELSEPIQNRKIVVYDENCFL